MPAIQLAELRKRSARLAELFQEPDAFVRELYDFLDHYANRAHRAGQSGEPPPLIEAFNVPKPVMRHIGIDLGSLAAENPQATLHICRALWEQPYLEHRQLAVVLLGKMRPQDPHELLELVEKWANPLPEDMILEALVGDGLAGMRAHAHKALIQRIADWLSSGKRDRERLGLRALAPLIEEYARSEAPHYFRLLTPYVRTCPRDHKADIEHLLRLLAQRTASETAYFLRQNLDAPDNPDAAWFARRTAPDLPPELREPLKAILRST